MKEKKLRDEVGSGGGGCALGGGESSGPNKTSSVGRCRGRGSECEVYVRETTSSAGYITYIPGETASRRPLAPSEEVHARFELPTTNYKDVFAFQVTLRKFGDNYNVEIR